MIRLIEKMRRAGDTVGGIVEGVARGVPAGWGEPVFDKLEADLAKAMLSLPRPRHLKSLRLQWHLVDWPPAQRPVSHEAWKGFYDDEFFRWNSGRHFQRADDFLSRRVQTGGHRHARAGHGGREIPQHDTERPWAPRSMCVASRGADGRGDDRIGAGGSCAPAKGTMRLIRRCPVLIFDVTESISI